VIRVCRVDPRDDSSSRESASLLYFGRRYCNFVCVCVCVCCVTCQSVYVCACVCACIHVVYTFDNSITRHQSRVHPALITVYRRCIQNIVYVGVLSISSKTSELIIDAYNELLIFAFEEIQHHSEFRPIDRTQCSARNVTSAIPDISFCDDRSHRWSTAVSLLRKRVR